jgi:hypothetical protein
MAQRRETTESLLTPSRCVYLQLLHQRIGAPWDVPPSHALEISSGTGGGRKNGAILETGYLSPHLWISPPYWPKLSVPPTKLTAQLGNAQAVP